MAATVHQFPDRLKDVLVGRVVRKSLEDGTKIDGRVWAPLLIMPSM